MGNDITESKRIMTNKKSIKWDVKHGYGVYQSVYTETLQKWIKEDRLKEGEVSVWTSGMSGWRRPEEMPEFERFFKRKVKKRKKVEIPEIVAREKPKKKGLQKVVIIDDEKDMCWLLEKDLKKRHYNAKSANSGRGGLELIRDEEPDVVLLDLRLKDVDGLNVLRKIKELWPKIKVIITTAFGGPIVKEKAIALGADGFVDKPFSAEDIIKEIKALE